MGEDLQITLNKTGLKFSKFKKSLIEMTNVFASYNVASSGTRTITGGSVKFSYCSSYIQLHAIFMLVDRTAIAYMPSPHSQKCQLEALIWAPSA